MELTSDRCEVECLHPEHVAPLEGAGSAPVLGLDRAAFVELVADARQPGFRLEEGGDNDSFKWKANLSDYAGP